MARPGILLVCAAALGAGLGWGASPARPAPGLDAGLAAPRGPTIGGVAPGQPLPGTGPTIPGVGTGRAPDAGVGVGPTVPTPATPDAGTGPGASVPVPSPTPPAAPPSSPPPAAKPDDGLKPGWSPSVGAVIELGGRKRLFVGDVFTVRVTVIARSTVPVNLPTALALGDFSLVGRGAQAEERLDGDMVRHSFALRVAAFAVGDLKLPAIPVTYVPPREAFQKPPEPGQPLPALVVTTSPLAQRISSVLANEPQPQLKKNAPPVPILVEDRRMRTLMIILVALLCGAALGFVIFYLVRKRRRRGPPPVPPRPADEIALEKLAALRASDLLARGEMKEFYLGVSEAIREYLGNRYGFDSLEMTTTELAEQMQKVPLTGLRLEELVHFLQDCDLVKFAKYIPPLSEAERILAQAEHIVRVTRFVPLPPEHGEDDEDAPRPPDPATPPAGEARHG